jgi:integrase
MAPKPLLKIDSAGRERVETGLYLAHSTSCERRQTKIAKAACSCRRYYAQVPTGRRGRYETCTIDAESREDAKLVNAELRLRAAKKKREVQSVGSPQSGVSLRQVFDEYAAHKLERAPKRWSPQTYVQRRDDWRIRIDPWLGAWQIEDLSNQDVKTWWAEINSLCAAEEKPRWNASTRNRCPNLLASVLTYAQYEMNYAVRVDIELVRRLERAHDTHFKAKRTDNVVSREEIIAVSKATTTLDQEVFILLFGLMGLRKSEALALTWGQVHLGPKPSIFIDRSARHVQPRQLSEDGSTRVQRQRAATPGEVKTKQSFGRVHMPPDVAAAVKRLHQQADALGWTKSTHHVFPGRELRDGVWVVDPTLMRNRKAPNKFLAGAIRRLNDPRSPIYKELKREGKPPFPEDFSPHNFRHSFGSGLVRKGVDLTRAAKAMRNKAETMQRTYVHDRPDDDLHEAIDTW